MPISPKACKPLQIVLYWLSYFFVYVAQYTAFQSIQYPVAFYFLLEKSDDCVLAPLCTMMVIKAMLAVYACPFSDVSRVGYQMATKDSLTNLHHPPCQHGGVKERLVLTRAHHRAHQLRVGCQDTGALLGEVNPSHGGHVVDVVVIPGTVRADKGLNKGNTFKPARLASI